MMLTLAVSTYAQTTGEKIKEFADKHMRLSGYLQGGYRYDTGIDEASTFYLLRARVSLTGDFAQDRLDYRLQVDMAGSPKICDLYVRYKPLNALNLELGQFKIPFSYENENCGPTTVEFIDYSYITTYLARNNGRYDGIAATGRDIGLQIYGGFIQRDGYSIINYNVGVFNGSGINIRDNNMSKDFIARLIIKPFKGFAVTGSYMYAETNYDEAKYMKSPRWAVGALYDSRHWIARSEYAEADFGGNLTRAFYAMAAYNFTCPVSVMARYEFINDDLKIMDEQRVTIGAAYKPFKFLRLQLNTSYTLRDKIAGECRNSFGVNLLATAMF